MGVQQLEMEWEGAQGGRGVGRGKEDTMGGVQNQGGFGGWGDGDMGSDSGGRGGGGYGGGRVRNLAVSFNEPALEQPRPPPPPPALEQPRPPPPPPAYSPQALLETREQLRVNAAQQREAGKVIVLEPMTAEALAAMRDFYKSPHVTVSGIYTRIVQAPTALLALSAVANGSNGVLRGGIRSASHDGGV